MNEIKNVLECIVKFDKTETLEQKGKYFDVIQKAVERILMSNPTILFTDIYNHLKIIENYLRGEHDHETSETQKREDWELYQETKRLKKYFAPF